MKRKLLAYAAAGLLLFAGCGAQSGAGQTSTPAAPSDTEPQQTEPVTGTLQEVADQYLTDLFASDETRLAACYTYDAAMEKVVSAGQLTTALADTFTQLGTPGERKPSFLTDSPPYTVVSTPCLFEKGSVNFNVVFNTDGKIAGVNIGVYDEGKTDPLPKGVTERDIEIAFDGGVLPGTLCMPENGKNLPVVVLVHGSGPNDRNETVGPNAPFRDLAWGLAQQGIATIRYDKRTKAAPESFTPQSTVMEETVNDAVSAVQLAGTIGELDPNRIYVLGHSLGGQLIPRIAANTALPAGYVILAGNVDHLGALLSDQLNYLAQQEGRALTAAEQALIEQAAQVQKPETMAEDAVVLGAEKAYWLDYTAYNPIEAAKAIKKPVLALQGERDYQVTPAQFELWRAAFGTSPNWNFISYPALNHLMIAGEGKPNAQEYQTPGKVDQKVIDDIAAFVGR